MEVEVFAFSPKTSNLHCIFWLVPLVALLQVVGHIIGYYPLILLKPLPIIMLLLLTHRTTKQERYFSNGLLFSLGGDLCLMISHNLAFQIGTLLFLVAHLLYIRSFMFDISEANLRKLKKKRHIALIAFISFIVTLLVFNMNHLWDKTPNLPLFFFYGAVISLMTITASLRSSSEISYWLTLLGAIFFGISDNTLAYFKFNHISSRLASGVIMATYYSAQALLFEGLRWSHTDK